MLFNKRKSFRLQIPEEREHAVLTVGNRDFQVRVLDESAGGFAVALIEELDVQQNQVHLLKTITGLYQVRIARIEHFADGKLLGLVRLSDLTEEGRKTLKGATRLEDMFAPQESKGAQSSRTKVGIGLAVTTAAVIGGLWLYGAGHLPFRPGPKTTQPPQKPSVAPQKIAEISPLPAAEGKNLAKETGVLQIKEPSVPSSKNAFEPEGKFSGEVFYRLQLTADQSRRVREVLDRSTSDLATLETEIRSILTPEQVKKWRTLAP
jgi:hypothetical protein